ncbi:MAG: hypothetical protein IPP71_12395 [Bacteroidetes bacterium]|nr:hypothetical protein [Bacteroidota bacterium]
MNKLVLICAITIYTLQSNPLIGQDTIPIISSNKHINLFYIEIGGNSPVFSLNYERELLKCTNSFIVFHTGLGVDYLKFNDGNFMAYSMPLEISHILFKSNHHLEYGIGVTPFISKTAIWSSYETSTSQPVDKKYSLYYLLIPEIGYRYQKTGYNWVFKLGYTPVLINSSDQNDKFKYRNHFGISAGHKF